MYLDISSTISKTKAKCYFYFILLWAESKYSQLKYITYNCIFSLKSSPMEYHSYIYISHYDILQNYMKYLNFYQVFKLCDLVIPKGKIRITINCLKRKISTSL